MTLPPIAANLLKIHTDDEEIRQKGQLVQTLILLLTAVATVHLLLNFIKLFQTGWTQPAILYFLGELLLIPLLSIGALLIVHNGRPTFAAHIIFVLLNTIIFLILLQADEPHSIPYFMLISIVAIATMASVRASIVYTILVILSISAYYLVRKPSPDYIEDITSFTLVALTIGLTAWITADRMQKWLRESTRLSHQMEAQTLYLDHRAKQLQRSAVISQSTSNILDQDELLKNIVYTIRDQYGFYFVAIYLLNQAGTKLVLTEAVGVVGEELKDKRFNLDIDANSIIGWVAKNQESYITHNVQEDPFYFNDPALKDTRSEAALPLIARGKLLGVLDVQSQHTNAFLEEDITVLQIMANQLAINVDNARLFTKTESHLAETQSLLNLNTALTSTLDVGEIYRRAARTFSSQINANLALITNWNEENDTAVSQIMHIRDGMQSQGSEFNLNPYTFPLAHFSSFGQALKQQKALIRHRDDPGFSKPEQTFLADQGQDSCLIVPITHGATPLGAVIIFRSSAQPEFAQSDLQLAQVMANETAVALNNALLTSEAQGRVAQLSALNRLSNRLSLAPTLYGIFEGTRREVLSLFEATSMSISLVTKDEQHLRWIYAYEYGQEINLTEIPPIPITQGFSGQVVRTRKRLLLNENMAEKSEQLGSVSVGVQTAAWLGVPLIVANKIIGVLAIENEHDPDAFDERAFNLLETIAGSTAIAISNQLQLEEIQAALAAQSEQRLQLETAAEISAATNSILDLTDLLENAVTLIKERFSLYYTGIFLSDPASNQAVLQAATGEAGKIQLEKGHKLMIGGRSLIGGATGDGRSRITQDVTQDEEWQPNVHLPDTRSELALPLRVRGAIIGALTVQSTEPNTFTPELVSILQTMSDQLAIAIANSRLLAATESRVYRQQFLNQISTQLHNTADTDEIIRVGLKALSEQVNGRSVNLFLGTSTNQTEEKVETA
ncbi:MAG: GAF domain-containing protein [Anaerolineae bacterium]|nr:GAF domain-containing protein [Anaerolineae bacterium]